MMMIVSDNDDDDSEWYLSNSSPFGLLMGTVDFFSPVWALRNSSLCDASTLGSDSTTGFFSPVWALRNSSLPDTLIFGPDSTGLVVRILSFSAEFAFDLVWMLGIGDDLLSSE